MTSSSFRTRESVIRAILRRERDGLPLNSEAVKGVSKALHCGAFRHFGSWRKSIHSWCITAAEEDGDQSSHSSCLLEKIGCRWNSTCVLVGFERLAPLSSDGQT